VNVKKIFFTHATPTYLTLELLNLQMSFVSYWAMKDDSIDGIYDTF